MNNDGIIDMIYDLLSKNDSKNLSRVNKTFHFVYNRRILNLHSVTHQLKSVFGKDIYDNLLTVMKECKSFLSGPFISNIINLNKSRSSIDIYCQCKNSSHYNFGSHYSWKCAASSYLIDRITEIYDKITYQNVKKDIASKYISDDLIKNILVLAYRHSFPDSYIYDKRKIAEILSLTIVSTYLIEEKCPLYKFIASNSNIKIRSDKYAEDFLPRSCSKITHKFELNNSIISLIHCDRSEIIGESNIDWLINKQDNTMNINYWIPEEPDSIFCGFPSLTLENKNLSLRAFDRRRWTNCHTYRDIFTYSINDLIPYDVFMYIINQSLYYRSILMLTELVLERYRLESTRLELDFRIDTNMSLLKNVMNNIETIQLDWSYIDNNIIHDKEGLFKIGLIEYKIHNRSRDISKIYEQIKDKGIMNLVDEFYVSFLSENCKKNVANNVISCRKYIVSHILMDSIKDKTFQNLLKIIEPRESYLFTENMHYSIPCYYILKDDIKAYNNIIEYNNNGYIVLNFPINGDRDINYFNKNPSKLPLLNNIFSKEYISTVKYKRKKETVKAIFSDRKIRKKYETLINMINTDIEIDKDLGYPKDIHTMFGDKFAKKFNDIVYNDNLYVFLHHWPNCPSIDSYVSITVVYHGDDIEDFMLYECNVRRDSSKINMFYTGTNCSLMLYYGALEEYLTMMEPPRVFEYWNGRETIVAQNNIFKYNPF
ncbi:hypothetical protein HDU92_008455 [Lobulomyces angularis]|nr:hypothetical protein HDU92_008455 [Lobulomyces angularis]